MSLLAYAAASILLTCYVSAYPTGAPEETCRIFTANHTVTAQGSRPQYDLTVTPTTVSPGGIAIVTLRGRRAEMFKGFFIQGQVQGSGQPIGKFKKQSGSQTRDCSGPGSANAVTHVNADDKKEISLRWQAPSSFVGRVVFKAVLVQTYEIFWDNIRSNTISVE